MNKKLLIFLMTIGIALIFVAGGIQAGTTVEDTFNVESKVFKTHTKGLATLSHKKHSTDYGISCGDCHHDKDGKPLADLKMGDAVQKCGECHTEGGKPTGADRKNISFLYNAMHTNCIDCHKEVNIKAGDPKGRKGPAPTSCTKCHPKK